MQTPESWLKCPDCDGGVTKDRLSNQPPDFSVWWDGESRQWIARGDYIRGLALFGETLEILGARCDQIIPELMKLNEQSLRPRITRSPPPPSAMSNIIVEEVRNELGEVTGYQSRPRIIAGEAS